MPAFRGEAFCVHDAVSMPLVDEAPRAGDAWRTLWRQRQELPDAASPHLYLETHSLRTGLPVRCFFRETSRKSSRLSSDGGISTHIGRDIGCLGSRVPRSCGAYRNDLW